MYFIPQHFISLTKLTIKRYLLHEQQMSSYTCEAGLGLNLKNTGRGLLQGESFRGSQHNRSHRLHLGLSLSSTVLRKNMRHRVWHSIKGRNIVLSPRCEVYYCITSGTELRKTDERRRRRKRRMLKIH